METISSVRNSAMKTGLVPRLSDRLDANPVQPRGVASRRARSGKSARAFLLRGPRKSHYYCRRACEARGVRGACASGPLCITCAGSPNREIPVASPLNIRSARGPPPLVPAVPSQPPLENRLGPSRLSRRERARVCSLRVAEGTREPSDLARRSLRVRPVVRTIEGDTLASDPRIYSRSRTTITAIEIWTLNVTGAFAPPKRRGIENLRKLEDSY